MSFKIIGICGHSGSGKGYVCGKFLGYGIPSIDTDRVYSELIQPEDGVPSPCVSELVSAFGNSIVNSDYTLNRRALSAIVFGKGNENLELLNKTTHKYILAETIKRVESYKADGARAVIIDAPVLFESGFNKLCDITVAVTAPLELSVNRIIERDSVTEDEARRRLSHQKDNDELRELCDFEIVNDNFADLKSQIETFIDRFLYEA